MFWSEGFSVQGLGSSAVFLSVALTRLRSTIYLKAFCNTLGSGVFCRFAVRLLPFDANLPRQPVLAQLLFQARDR